MLGLAGDAYLILNTRLSTSGKLEHDIHFWLGKGASQVCTIRGWFGLKEVRCLLRGSKYLIICFISSFTKLSVFCRLSLSCFVILS
jgi:hypothetical protein